MRSRTYILLLICLAASSAFAGPPAAIKDYLALRRKLATQVPFQTIKAEPGACIGKVFELRGMYTGSIALREGQACSIIISTPSGSYSIIADSPPTKTPGAEFAFLVKVGERSTISLSDLSLVACTHLAEVDRAEAAAKPVEVKEVRKPVEPPHGTQPKGKPVTRITGEQLVAIYKKAVRRFNSRLSDSQADTIARSILGFSLRYKVDARLVCAVILAESHFRIGATSPAGAQGLGQLMPSTAAGLGVNDAYNPIENVYGSVRYIKGMLDRMSGNKHWNELTWNDLALALAAYNAGPGAVKKHGGVPPYRETRNYVARVTSIYKQLCGVK